MERIKKKWGVVLGDYTASDLAQGFWICIIFTVMMAGFWLATPKGISLGNIDSSQIIFGTAIGASLFLALGIRVIYFNKKIRESLMKVDFKIVDKYPSNIEFLMTNVKEMVYKTSDSAPRKRYGLVKSFEAGYKEAVAKWRRQIETKLAKIHARIEEMLRDAKLLEASREIDRYLSWLNVLRLVNVVDDQHDMLTVSLRKRLDKMKVEIESAIKVQLEYVKGLHTKNQDAEACMMLREIEERASAAGLDTDPIIQTIHDIGWRIREGCKKELQAELASLKILLPNKIKNGDFGAVSGALTHLADVATREKLMDISSGARDLLNQLDLINDILHVIDDRKSITVDDLCTAIDKPRVNIVSVLVDWSASIGFTIENGIVTMRSIDMSKLVEYIDTQFDAWAKLEQRKEGKKI